MEGQGEVTRDTNQSNGIIGGGGGGNGGDIGCSSSGGGGGVRLGGRKSREEHESRSEGHNFDGASGDDDHDGSDNHSPRRMRRHRHTPQQIQELEGVFKVCPRPDEKQILDLSKKLCLETRQVKFWFQNRRTQMKTRVERTQSLILRQKVDKLKVENMHLREAMRNSKCTNCDPAIIRDISVEEQHLRTENARLKDELNRVCELTSKLLGRPVSSLSALSSSIGGPLTPSPSSELAVGTTNGGSGPLTSVTPSSLPLPTKLGSSGVSNALPPVVSSIKSTASVSDFKRSMYIELAVGAMNELVTLAQSDEPLWLSRIDGDGKEVLNHDEYRRSFNPIIGVKPSGYVPEATRETGMVIINSLTLVQTLMDVNRWAEMFPGLIAKASTTDIISSGMGGTRNGALQLMHAELQVLSPLVPVRVVNFLRYCKQLAKGTWAVVDVSIDCIGETSSSQTYMNRRRLPSGCLVEDMPNGYSKVTWVEHSEYEESGIHQLYRPLVSSGLGFGAQKWIATLKRQCECLAILMSSSIPLEGQIAIQPAGRKSMLKLAQRMTNNFCAGVCASTVHKWNKLTMGNFNEDVQIMTRTSMDVPGELAGIVLSSVTSVWLPVSPQRLFGFLRDQRLRGEWDIHSDGGPIREMARIVKGQDQGNCVSLLEARDMNSNQKVTLILQETCTDASGSLVVYAPVDIAPLHAVMNGGDSACVALLPLGFSIVPDGPGSCGPNVDTNVGPQRAGGSLLTVAFQIIANNLPTVDSVGGLSNLISCTVQKIKAALNCEAS